MIDHDDDCTACRGNIRHDHREAVAAAGAHCAHARSDGSWRSCCSDVLAQEVGMRAAAFRLRHGAGPVDAREITGETTAPPDARELLRHSDPVGAAWWEADENDRNRRGGPVP